LLFVGRLEKELIAATTKANSLEAGAAGHDAAISGCVVWLATPPPLLLAFCFLLPAPDPFASCFSRAWR
jgi:hypothetical protein